LSARRFARRGALAGLSRAHNARETRDIYECIEWAAGQPWSNGKVGMNGISYYASNQWRAAAAQPPHLAAILRVGRLERCLPRERAARRPRLQLRKNWQDMQVKTCSMVSAAAARRTRIPASSSAGRIP